MSLVSFNEAFCVFSYFHINVYWLTSISQLKYHFLKEILSDLISLKSRPQPKSLSIPWYIFLIWITLKNLWNHFFYLFSDTCLFSDFPLYHVNFVKKNSLFFSSTVFQDLEQSQFQILYHTTLLNFEKLTAFPLHNNLTRNGLKN